MASSAGGWNRQGWSALPLGSGLLCLQETLYGVDGVVSDDQPLLFRAAFPWFLWRLRFGFRHDLNYGNIVNPVGKVPPPGFGPGRPGRSPACKAGLSANSSTGACQDVVGAAAGWPSTSTPPPSLCGPPTTAQPPSFLQLPQVSGDGFHLLEQRIDSRVDFRELDSGEVDFGEDFGEVDFREVDSTDTVNNRGINCASRPSALRHSTPPPLVGGLLDSRAVIVRDGLGNLFQVTGLRQSLKDGMNRRQRVFVLREVITQHDDGSSEMVPDPTKTCLGLEYFCFKVMGCGR